MNCPIDENLRDVCESAACVPVSKFESRSRLLRLGATLFQCNGERTEAYMLENPKDNPQDPLLTQYMVSLRCCRAGLLYMEQHCHELPEICQTMTAKRHLLTARHILYEVPSLSGNFDVTRYRLEALTALRALQNVADIFDRARRKIRDDIV